MEQIEQIETTTLRDYLSGEMSRLHSEATALFREEPLDNLGKLCGKTAKLAALQEIIYRLEYGFIEEIGTKDLREWLAKP